MNNFPLFQTITLKAMELPCSLAISIAVCMGVVINARRCERPFPGKWLIAIAVFMSASHGFSIWAQTAAPLSVAAILLILLGCILSLRWKKEAELRN